MIDNYNQMTEEQHDILKEFGNIGAGNALTALSQMIEKEIDLQLTDICIVNAEKLHNVINCAESHGYGVIVRVTGDMELCVIFMLNDTFAELLAKDLTGEGIGSDGLTAMQESCLKEVGNIMGNSYINALVSMLDVSFQTSLPVLEAGNCKDILRSFYPSEETQVFMIKNTFSYLGQSITGDIVLIPTMKSLQAILEITQ